MSCVLISPELLCEHYILPTGSWRISRYFPGEFELCLRNDHNFHFEIFSSMIYFVFIFWGRGRGVGTLWMCITVSWELIETGISQELTRYLGPPAGSVQNNLISLYQIEQDVEFNSVKNMKTNYLGMRNISNTFVRH